MLTVKTQKCLHSCFEITDIKLLTKPSIPKNTNYKRQKECEIT